MTIDSLSKQANHRQRQANQESTYVYNARRNAYIDIALTGARKNEKEISRDKAPAETDDVIVDISIRSTNTKRTINPESGTDNNTKNFISARYPIFLWLRTIFMIQEIIKHEGVYVDRFV